MDILINIGKAVQCFLNALLGFLWGDLIKIPLPGGKTLDVSFLVLLLALSGIFFTFRTRFVQFRMIPKMLKVATERNTGKKGLSGIQALIVATATRVGMGNLAGVVAAISVGGAGSVFWMWVFALFGSSLAFVESVLAQMHKKEDKINGGFIGGPAYYIHDALIKPGNKRKKSFVAILFAISGITCLAGVSQVASNSVTSAVKNAFNVPTLVTTLLMVALALVIVFKNKKIVKVLDFMVPIMAGGYFLITLFVILKNLPSILEVFFEVLAQAFGFRQVVAGGIGAVIVTGAKRGIFSNEAGSGNTPNVVAMADVSHPAKAGLMQCLGVFLDTLICTCTAFLILLIPKSASGSTQGMELLQTAMNYHVGSWGSSFITIILILFSFSTFLGLLLYARPSVTYIFGQKKIYQILYKIFFVIMLFLGGLNAYTFVWDLADLGIGLMTIFNILALFLLSKEANNSLKEYKIKEFSLKNEDF